MIPDEAVEAAAQKLYQAGGLTVWSKEDESTKNYYRRNARSALEAAAPHIRAEALEDAAKLAEIGEGGGADSGECEDWSAWLRSRANTERPTDV